MVDAVLGQLARMAGTTSIVLREPRLPTGFPDLVVVTPSRAMVLWRSKSLPLAQRQLKLLHHIAICEAVHEETLASALGWSEHAMSSEIDRLCGLGLLRKRNTIVSPGPSSQRLIPDRIMAVEAKMHDWTGAIRQAAANTWFASESYILVPSSIVSPRLKEEARHWGVGVIEFAGAKTCIASRAPERELPASYGSWVIAHMVGQALMAAKVKCLT